MHKTILLLFCLSCFAKCFSQQTRFEKTKGAETAGYFEVMDFYRMLAKGNRIVRVKEHGQTDAGYPLHTVLISNDRIFDPVKWHEANKVVIMINNGIHAGEPDGIDASMMLVRDIKNRKVILPDNVALAFIPVYNIGGSLNRNSTTRVNQNGPVEYGFRGNSQNLDLNRDFTKNDSRDSRSFATIFHWLNPDIFIDNHVSDGADFQHIITLITTQYEKLGPVQGKWLREVFEPQIYAGMKEKNRDLIPYVEFDAANFDKGIDMYYETPRFSSGYAALFGCFSFIPETHMLKPYADRVLSTYQLMTTFIDKASVNATALLAQRKVAAEAKKTQQRFPLRWSIDRSANSTIIFKGYEQDTTLSEATGLKKMFYNRNKPYTKAIKFFDRYKAEREIEKPKAYIIPAGWYPVIERLQLNGVRVQPLLRDTMINVTVYHIEDYKSRPASYEKHHANYAVKVSKETEKMKFLKGDYFVEMDQYANRYIIEMLEPTGDDSFFTWNFFDAVLQRKEGYSDYRWEDIAAGVLKNDATLKEILDTKKRSDPAFAASSSAILNFIYKNSIYAEKAFMRYPVYRIEK
ncbi:MAG: M14 family zinc carboxypeptidase [Ferruginibacter sp.]